MRYDDYLELGVKSSRIINIAVTPNFSYEGNSYSSHNYVMSDLLIDEINVSKGIIIYEQDKHLSNGYLIGRFSFLTKPKLEGFKQFYEDELR